ncbi:unnamed protein product [Brassica napus]|uniref:(rape) hypothetical protein n=1 Tax=Brassica napus TaxID=3708 RepID=A0A816XJK7_BRANA|nr:unnamed protein product [Brassica napus]
MRFKKGSRVEVFSNKEAPYGAWRCAEIISGNGHTYNVRYFSFHEEAVMERVPRKVIRPCPPQVDVERWEAGELVEVLDSFSWKAATVRQELCGNYYVVRLLGTPAEFTFHKANVRVRQSWQDERWVAIGKISGSVKSSLLTGSDVQRKLKPQVNSKRLQEPSVVVSARMLKRPSPNNWPECAESCTGNTKKIRSLEAPSSKNRETGCCQMVRVRSKGSSESVRAGSLVADDCNDSDASSVGSCSAASDDDESNMPPCMLDGSGPQADSCSSEAESFCGLREEARRKHSVAGGDGVRRSCRSELYTYRSTLGDLFASGPLSWEQETSLTDLRLSLNISDDEHLMEVKNLISADGFYQSSELYNQRQRNWRSSSDGFSSYGNHNQENAGFVHSPNQSDPQVQSHQDNSGYDSLDALCREGNVKEAVDIIKSWRNQGYIVDLPRLLWIAKLCGDAQALQEAKVVHEFITSSVSRSDISAYNSVIEMYSACESVEDAIAVFESIPEKNSQTWCGIIRCLAKNGHEEDAVDMFSRFKEEGNRPDGEVFKEVFFACGVLGDVNEGLLHFESMRRDYGIVPDMEHYVSIVKMLAEPGYLDEALRFVELVEPNAVDLWETLMNLARVHGDLELGDRCQDVVEQLDACRLSKESKAGLVPVKSSDSAKEKLQRMTTRDNNFRAGDISLPENREYYMALKSLKEHMVELGYVPESRLALHDVEQESRDENLFNHNERFAFVSSFLNTPARSEVLVRKNLRVCIDCHNALKLMSKIVGRRMISRDVKRYHHMEDGVCSCRDYW